MIKYIYLYTCKDTTPKGIPVFEAVTGNSHLTFPIPVLKYFNNSFKIGSHGDKIILQLTVVSFRTERHIFHNPYLTKQAFIFLLL